MPPILLKWFTAFLRDRKQRVKDKTKDMVFSFGNAPDIQPIIMNDAVIERVESSKLLGVHIQDNLK